MRKYRLDLAKQGSKRVACLVPDPEGTVYVASDVEARISELERVLRNVQEHNECPDCNAEINRVLSK